MSNEMISVPRAMAELCAQCLSNSGYEEAHQLRALLAKPVVECQQPFAWFTEDYLIDKSSTTYDELTSNRWREKGWPVHPLYTRPAEQPAPVAVVLPVDWQDQLFAEMDRLFELRKFDEDHMANDDTQIGVEFSMKWVADRLDEVARLNPPQQ